MDNRYVAGLFDGEGYVRINKWQKPDSAHIRYNIFVGIGMTHRPVIEALQKRYGGSLNMNRHDLRNSKHRIQFTWNASSQVAARFLRKIRPYLIVKAEEADIALQLQDHIDSSPYKERSGRKRELRPGGEAVNEFRDDLYLRITALKKRSFPPITT